jgi:hypothetical protein
MLLCLPCSSYRQADSLQQHTQEHRARWFSRGVTLYRMRYI